MANDRYSDHDEDILADVPERPIMTRIQIRLAATAKPKPKPKAQS